MGFVRNLTGKTAAKAAVQGAEIQSAAATEAAAQVGIAGEQAGTVISDAGTTAGRQVGRGGRVAGELVQAGGTEAGALLDPFQAVGQQGIDQAGFLTDPKAQFDFLQNNPLFQLGLDSANRETSQFAASRGRLTAGDTLEQLNNNALLTASPLIAQQKQSIGDLLSLGQSTAINQGNILQNTAGSGANILQNTAGSRADITQNTGVNVANILQGTAANQGNLLTGAAAAEAAGLVGAANARGAGAANILNLGAQIGGAAIAASDPLLKTNIKPIGTENGYNIYSWDWNLAANDIGLHGSSSGVMADEVKLIKPDAVTTFKDGFMRVDYLAIGVKH